MDCRLPGFSIHGISQRYWNGFLFPFQGILLTQGLNLHLLHWQADSLPLSHQGHVLLLKFMTELDSSPSLSWVDGSIYGQRWFEWETLLLLLVLLHKSMGWLAMGSSKLASANVAGTAHHSLWCFIIQEAIPGLFFMEAAAVWERK